MGEEVFLKSRGKSGTERGQGNQGERQGKDEAKRGKYNYVDTVRLLQCIQYSVLLKDVISSYSYKHVDISSMCDCHYKKKIQMAWCNSLHSLGLDTKPPWS